MFSRHAAVKRIKKKPKTFDNTQGVLAATSSGNRRVSEQEEGSIVNGSGRSTLMLENGKDG
jgi:hypothetical protein